MGVVSCGTTMLDQGVFQNIGAVTWDTTAKTAGFTAVSGNGYFVNTTSGAITVTLPAGSAGDVVALADYAATWQTNNVTVAPNGSDKIGGANVNATLDIEGQSVTFVYVDSTQGWVNVIDSTSNVRGQSFITATGGTITTSGDYKIHTFTSPGTFTVTCAGSPTGSDSVDYLVVAGGGGGGESTGPNQRGAGGGGAGGYRESSGAASGCYTASPLGAGVSALPVTVTGYPITVGGGGAGGSGTNKGSNGSNSIFSSITSTGGGGGALGGYPNPAPLYVSQPGGSGGGLGSTSGSPRTAATGNTPPVSPPQGNPGGGPRPCNDYLGGTGGGGATTAGSPLQGTPADPNYNGGAGGAGATTNITASPATYAAGAQGGDWNTTGPGTTGGANTGTAGAGGGANVGGGATGSNGNAGGSGIVVIRYKFQ